jgi:acetolactate synthase-1/2/3 large subunit
MKYAECLVSWLKQEGYGTCYFVAGGNIMHLLDGVRNQLRCIPMVHEVAAAIAVEYHNEAVSGQGDAERAFAMVTAGPGLTNALTGMAGAYLESRELLLLGGQVKREDLAPRNLRQLGIQEVDGVAMAAPVTKASECLLEPWPRERLLASVRTGCAGRPGPVFLELPLDVQAAQVPDEWVASGDRASAEAGSTDSALLAEIAGRIRNAERPLLLLGGGLSRQVCRELQPWLRGLELPLMTTWNGADRLDAASANYFGRPNTWGMRYSNLLLQQCDLLVAVGTRLGLQQTGFNWQSFVPGGQVIQVEIDPQELAKPNPRVDLPVCADANGFLNQLADADLGSHPTWLTFCRRVQAALPLSESVNTTGPGFLNPYDFALQLSALSGESDVVVPCSSGGAYTVMMQSFTQKYGQTIITDKGLASMGYGLSGAIGAAIARPKERVILVEGDGGFTQNLQELATVSANRLNLKIFIFANNGYASIRMTQKNYFAGSYLGCDVESGLGFPDWKLLFAAYGIPYLRLAEDWADNPSFLEGWNSSLPAAFEVPLDPEQNFFPKISSRVRADGGMESNPLHLMSPSLEPHIEKELMPYIKP